MITIVLVVEFEVFELLALGILPELLPRNSNFVVAVEFVLSSLTLDALPLKIGALISALTLFVLTLALSLLVLEKLLHLLRRRLFRTIALPLVARIALVFLIFLVLLVVAIFVLIFVVVLIFLVFFIASLIRPGANLESLAECRTRIRDRDHDRRRQQHDTHPIRFAHSDSLYDTNEKSDPRPAQAVVRSDSAARLPTIQEQIPCPNACQAAAQ